MDEYVFLLLAKLKADRSKLQREQRATVWAPDSSNERIEADRRSTRRATLRNGRDGESTSELHWRVQS